MPVVPSPYKVVCPKCGYSKVIKPKSDALGMGDAIAGICPKCHINMEQKSLNILDVLLGGFRR